MSAIPAPPTEAPEEVAVPDEVVEEAPLDAEAPEETTDVEAEAAEGAEPDDAQALLDAIEELGEDDPLVQKLREKLAPPAQPFEEREAQWYDQQETTELTNWRTAAEQKAADFDSTATYQRALATAWEFTQKEAARIQAAAQAIANGDENSPDPAKEWVFDADATAAAIANHVTQEVEAAAPAIRGHVAARTLETVLADYRQSPIHKMLTKEDREAIAVAKRNQFADHRIALINRVYMNRAIQGAGELLEGQTKAQTEAAEKKAAARERLATAVGRRVPSTNGNGRSKSYLNATDQEWGQLKSEDVDAEIQRKFFRR